MGAGASSLPRDEHEMARFQSLCDAYEKRHHFGVRVHDQSNGALREFERDLAALAGSRGRLHFHFAHMRHAYTVFSDK